MHSEHILKERSDAQNVVSRFPCGDTTRRRQAVTTLGAKPRQPSRQRRVQRRSRIGGGERSEPISRILLAVRTAMEHPIGALPCTPFPASRDFPSRGNERYGEKNRASYTSCTIPVCPPLVAGATTFPPQAGALWMLSHGAMSLQESIERFILSPGWGKVRRSRIRGSRVAANH